MARVYPEGKEYSDDELFEPNDSNELITAFSTKAFVDQFLTVVPNTNTVRRLMTDRRSQDDDGLRFQVSTGKGPLAFMSKKGLRALTAKRKRWTLAFQHLPTIVCKVKRRNPW